MKSLPIKQKLVAAAIGLMASCYAIAGPAPLFDPDGNAATNTTVTFASFDQKVGNALAIGVNANSPVGTQFNLLYQANLNSIQNSGGTNVFSQGGVVGGAARNFTFTAGFREQITGNTTVGGNGVLTFGFASPASAGPTATNFFYMYATSAEGNNLAGTGFAVGAPILSGHFVSSGFGSFFSANGVGGALDQNGGNDYPGVTTVTGVGSTSATLVIDSFNTAYFPNLVAGATTSFVQTTQSLAFITVDPSAQFSGNGLANGGTPGATSVGAVNGFGANTIFAADASQSFVIPEPMPAALLGLGLLAMGLARRKSKKA